MGLGNFFKGLFGGAKDAASNVADKTADVAKGATNVAGDVVKGAGKVAGNVADGAKDAALVICYQA